MVKAICCQTLGEKPRIMRICTDNLRQDFKIYRKSDGKSKLMTSDEKKGTKKRLAYLQLRTRQTLLTNY